VPAAVLMPWTCGEMMVDMGVKAGETSGVKANCVWN
jgi:hypothetical protein